MHTNMDITGFSKRKVGKLKNSLENESDTEGGRERERDATWTERDKGRESERERRRGTKLNPVCDLMINGKQCKMILWYLELLVVVLAVVVVVGVVVVVVVVVAVELGRKIEKGESPKFY